jgi:K+-transporting ATPase ATPase C chain
VEAAIYQAKRVADARGLPEEVIRGLIENHALKTGGMLTPEPLVNVLLLNIDLDRKAK